MGKLQGAFLHQTQTNVHSPRIGMVGLVPTSTVPQSWAVTLQTWIRNNQAILLGLHLTLLTWISWQCSVFPAGTPSMYMYHLLLSRQLPGNTIWSLASIAFLYHLVSFYSFILSHMSHRITRASLSSASSDPATNRLGLPTEQFIWWWDRSFRSFSRWSKTHQTATCTSHGSYSSWWYLVITVTWISRFALVCVCNMYDLICLPVLTLYPVLTLENQW